jgi:MFS family permease
MLVAVFRVLSGGETRATLRRSTSQGKPVPFSLRPRLSPIWQNRDFRLYWVADAISELGSSLSWFALPIVAAVTLKVSPGQMGFMRALGNVPVVFVGLLAGVWVDRVSRLRLLIGLNLAAAALVASVPLAYALDALTVEHLYALSLAFGLLWPFWGAAHNAVLPSIVTPDQLVDGNSKLQLTWTASGIAGPGIGGVLIGLVRAPFLMLIDAASFVVTVMFLAGVRTRVPEQTGDDAPPGRVRSQILDGLRATFVDPIQRAITIPRAILDLLDSLSMTVIVLYILRDVRLTASLMGLAFALSSVGFVAGSLIAPRVERRLEIGGMIAFGLFLVAASPYTMVIANDSLPDAVNVLFFAIPGFIGGTGGVIQFIGLSSLRQAITPERMLGRVWASASVLGAILAVVGAAVGGILGETVGLRAAVIVAAVGYAVPFVYVWLSPLRHATRIAATADTTNEAGAEPESVT